MWTGTGIVKDWFRVQYQWNNSGTPTWTTITDSCFGLVVLDRPGKSAGVVQLNVYNDLLDPSKNPANDEHLRKGQKLRLQAKVDGSWSTQFTGTLTDVDVDPDPLAAKKRGGKRRILVKAKDSIHARQQNPHKDGVGTSDDLRAFLATPFNINGETTTKSATGVEVYEHDNTSEWDQILLTRDTEQGFAWVDKADVLNVSTRAGKASGTVATITGDDYNAPGLQLNYTIENLLNHITVKEHVKYKNGKIRTAHKGVYKDQDSIDAFGAFKATYTVQGYADWGDVEDWTDALLAANAWPEIVPNKLVIPILDEADVEDFVDAIDLTDKVTVTVEATTYTARVDTIKMEIGPDRWLLTLTLIDQNIRYRPTVKPLTGNANITDGMVETDAIDDGAVTAAKTSFNVNEVGGVGYITDPTFARTLPDPNGWDGPTLTGISIVPNANRAGTGPVLRFATNAATRDLISQPAYTWKIVNGTTFRLDAIVKAAAAVAANKVAVTIRWDATDGTSAYTTAWNPAWGAAGWYTNLSGSVTHPNDGKTYHQAGAYVTVVGSTTQIDFERVTVRSIITADLIAADAIDGRVITGSTLQTAASGERVVVDAATATGRVWFYSGITGEAAGYVEADSIVVTSPDAYKFGYLRLRPPKVYSGGNAAPQIELSSGTGMAGGQPVKDAQIRYTAAAGHYFDTGGVTIGSTATVKGIDFGHKNTGTTDASANITITHNLGAAPASVQLTPADGLLYRIVSTSSTNFVVRVRNTSGTNQVGVTPDVFWLAVR